MLFGMQKVGRRLHFFATLMVAVGTFISAFWILSVNSWMQTPTGYAINADGQFVPAAGWAAIIFNPSFPYRLVHTVIAAYLTTALAVGAVGAWHLLKDSRQEHARKMFSMAMWMAALVAPVQIFVGDLHGLNTLEHQPAKVMAMEGHYQSHPQGAPLILFGIPNDEDAAHGARRRDPAAVLADPQTRSRCAARGLDTIAPENRPPVEVVFWTFRVMVGLGFLMLLLGACSLLARAARKLYDWRWLLRFALAHGSGGIHRGDRRLDHHRSRPPAFHDLRPDAHGGFRLAARRARGRHLADRLRRRVLRGVRHGQLVPAQAHVARAAAARGRTCRTRPRTPRASRRGRRWPRFAAQGGAAWMTARVLTNIWAAILAFAVFMYVVMDGFDLGIGILFPAFGVGRERDTAMNSIAPVWDGNETWLVLGGGGLMAAFPLAYARHHVGAVCAADRHAAGAGVPRRGLRVPLARSGAPRTSGISHSPAVRSSPRSRRASCSARCCRAYTVEGRAYGGGWWDWLTPFSLLTGVSVVAGYSLLGACWLNWKTDGETQKHARRLMRILAPVTLARIAAVSVATPFLGGEYLERWFAMPARAVHRAGAAASSPSSPGVLRAACGATTSLRRSCSRSRCSACRSSASASACIPYLVPNSITLQMAAAPASSQAFMLVGARVLVPLILAYTAWSYWVFRGKVAHEGYH